jgi:hypothetical protein
MEHTVCDHVHLESWQLVQQQNKLHFVEASVDVCSHSTKRPMPCKLTLQFSLTLLDIGRALNQ